MKIPEGYEVIEDSEERLVIEKHFGYNNLGVIREIFPKNTSKEEAQAAINDVARILYKARVRRLQAEARAAEKESLKLAR
ncbi:MAG: hypothetical protein LUD03_01615 [Firmicutes bacterium]|nr:hypothetical protein [Bacillota bacterium]